MKKRLILILIVTALIVWDQAYIPDNLVSFQKQAEEIYKDRVLPAKKFTTDGCSMWPNSTAGYSWEELCIEHDMAYWVGGTEQERLEADQKFRDGVNKISPFVGNVMYSAVRLGGNKWVPAPWRWGYGWAYPYDHQEVIVWDELHNSKL